MTAHDPPSASVVIAAYNAEDTIEECLRSLLALRYPRDRLELVVVDNGSRDRTREIVQRFVDRVTLVDEARRGPAAARNAGMRRSGGEVIALTDADCTVHENWLTALVAPLADPAVGIAGGTILARRPASPIELFGESIHDHRRAIEFWRPPYVVTMNWAARRDVVDKVGPFDESLLRGEDGDFSYRAGQAGYELVFCPEAIVYHRNERSLPGLFKKGWQHGFYAAPVVRRHARLIAEAVSGMTGDPAASSVDGRPARTRYYVVFESGKRIGDAMGRVWLRLGRA